MMLTLHYVLYTHLRTKNLFYLEHH